MTAEVRCVSSINRRQWILKILRAESFDEVGDEGTTGGGDDDAKSLVRLIITGRSSILLRTNMHFDMRR